MKTILFVLSILCSTHLLANEVKGLKCESLFVTHEYNQLEEINKVQTSESLFRWLPVYDKKDIIPVDNKEKIKIISYNNFINGFAFDLEFKLDVKNDITKFELTRTIDDDFISFGEKSFKTNEGFLVTFSMNDKLKIQQNSFYKDKEFLNITDVIVSCRPVL